MPPETIKCANCGVAVGAEPHVCQSNREFLTQNSKPSLKERDIWKEAAKLLAQKKVEKTDTAAQEDKEDEEEEESAPIEGGEDYEIEEVNAEPWDDQGLKKIRMRGYTRPRFQRYQFRLFPTSSASSPGNRGTNPDFANQLWEARRRGDLKSEKESVSGAPPRDKFAGIPNLEQIIPATGIDVAAQAMPRGFSVGVPSSKFDYTQIPREPTERTAWVFDDPRFRDFIVRSISDEAVVEFEKDPNIKPKELARLFGSALKAFFNLYNFFRVGQSDAGFMADVDPDLKIPRGFWTSEESRRMHRSRLLAEGFERYGSPLVNYGYGNGGKAVPDVHPERTARVWPIFIKVVRKIR